MAISRASLLAVGLLALASTVSGQGKRGLNYNSATWANYFKGYPKVTWGYNWGWPSNGLDSSFEFASCPHLPKTLVPMLWGAGSTCDPNWTSAALAANHVLGYNEPDLGSQANVIPSIAATSWQMCVQPLAGKVSIGGPAVTNAGNGVLPYIGLGWLDSFLGDCGGCQIDFMPVHWYANDTPANFYAYLETAHSRSGGKPIWVTEFMLQDSEANQIAWMKQVLPWMDAQSWIGKYAYFGVFEDFLINGAGNGLSNIGKAYATI